MITSVLEQFVQVTFIYSYPSNHRRYRTTYTRSTTVIEYHTLPTTCLSFFEVPTSEYIKTEEILLLCKLKMFLIVK